MKEWLADRTDEVCIIITNDDVRHMEHLCKFFI